MKGSVGCVRAASIFAIGICLVVLLRTSISTVSDETGVLEQIVI
jgi:hypothetical protein